jgi:hypothetical protein
MRSILACLALLVASASNAQAPGPSLSNAYIAARERADVELAKLGNDLEKKASAERPLLRKLDPLLRAAIGPIPVPKGFNTEPMTIPHTLCCEMGLHMADGLMFSNNPGYGMVLVTTDTIFRHWLKRPERGGPAVADVEQALQNADVLAAAIGDNWGIRPFAALPIAKPPGATFAFATLAFGHQGSAAGPPPQILVSVAKGGLVYISIVDRIAADPPIEACGARFADYQAKAKAVRGPDAPTKPGNIEAARRLDEEGQAVFEKCWAERATGGHAFPAATKEAQAFADSLAGG